jgi:hypothetical protein
MSGPASSSRQYDYKKPSSFNLVSFLMLIALAAGGYWGWKFGPVYWNRYKVEEIVREGAAEASSIRRMTEQAQLQIEQKVVSSVTQRLEDERHIGADNQVQVWFEGNYATLNVSYVVTVRHPFGKSTIVHVRRTAPVAE